jgi:hypothetical protein
MEFGKMEKVFKSVGTCTDICSLIEYEIMVATSDFPTKFRRDRVAHRLHLYFSGVVSVILLLRLNSMMTLLIMRMTRRVSRVSMIKTMTR